jgi:hypothetical protein
VIECTWQHVSAHGTDKRIQINGNPGIFPVNRRQFPVRKNFHTEFLANFAVKRIDKRFTLMHFAAGKFPQATVGFFRFPACGQYRIPLFDNRTHHLHPRIFAHQFSFE